MCDAYFLTRLVLGVRAITYHSQAKIALKAETEDELLELEAIAKSLNLCARTVTMDPCVSLLYSDIYSECECR